MARNQYLNIMLDKIRDEISKKLGYYPFKKWVLTKVMQSIDGYMTKAIKYDQVNNYLHKQLSIEVSAESDLAEAVKHLYTYPKEVEEGIKTPYDYHVYLKTKVQWEVAKNKIKLIKELLNY